MRRRVGLLVVLTALSLAWLSGGRPLGGVALLGAEPLPNPGLAAARYQTGPFDTATLTPTLPAVFQFPVETPLPVQTPAPVQPFPIQTPIPLPTVAPPPTQPPRGLPPTIPPVIGTRVTPAPTAVVPGVTPFPGQPTVPSGVLPPGVPTAPGLVPPGVPTLPGAPTAPRATGAAGSASGSPTPAVTPATGATRVTATATTPLVGVRTYSGPIVQKDDASLVVRVPNQGELTVTPGDDTEIRRDNVAATLAMLSIGDQATIVLGPNDELLRILVTTRPLAPEPPADETGVNVLTVIWQALLGLVMMGLVLIFDSELRTKFLAALLEPSSSYPYGRR